MCGIVGAVSARNIVPVLIEGLKRLEYRGYDSCGVAVHQHGGLLRARSTERVAELERNVADDAIASGTGIAHTRWATHGVPAVHNAHPHFSGDRIALVHNGIIENHDELRAELQSQGYVFASQTDTEVIAHLIDRLYEGDLLTAVQRALPRLRGAYAIAVFCRDAPHRLIGAREAVRWPTWLVMALTGWAVAVIAIDQALHPLWTRPAYTATQLVSVVLLPVILAWRGLVQHVRAAQLMLLASLPSLLGVGLRLGRNLGLLPPHPITDSAYYFGLAAYLLLLNYTVSQRYLTLRREKEEAQALALAASRRAEQELEKRVAQRTADIEAAMRQVQTSLELERKLLSNHRAFYATVSHELRTPVAVIAATAENLAMLDTHAEPSTSARYRKIVDASQRLSTLLDRYLRQDRFDRSAGLGRSSAVNLRLLLEDAAQAARMAGHGQSVQVDVEAPGEPFVCDEVLTRLALNSLAENAAKYTPPGATILVRGRVAIQQDGRRQATLEIVDDGPGISGLDLPKVFDPAFRGVNAAGVPGTGMGLPLAQRMIELQGGALRLDSGPGHGTRALVVLPEGSGEPTSAPAG